MGNHQTNAKRQHRPSESVGFNKHESDDERLVTIQRRENRVIAGEMNENDGGFFLQTPTKSAPPLEETSVVVNPNDSTLTTFSIPVMPFDTHACVTGTFTNWIEKTMTKW